MDNADLKLDGNAAAGELQEIFGAEMTLVRATCAACGAVWEMGALSVYVHAPGMVFRCPGCEAVLLRIVRTEERVWLDPSGVRCLDMR